MTIVKPKFIVVLLSLFAVNFFFSCAHKEPKKTEATDVEIWDLQLTGDTQGNIRMLLERTEIEKGIYAIAGKLNGKIDDHIGGIGEADYKLEGRIEKDRFKVRFSGYSGMAEGPSHVSGDLTGTVFNSQGSGTWRALHAQGFSAGKYTMKKIRSSQ